MLHNPEQRPHSPEQATGLLTPRAANTRTTRPLTTACATFGLAAALCAGPAPSQAQGTLPRLVTQYSFTDGLDGALPNGLAQGKDGSFYGTTYGDGNSSLSNYGNVFKITSTGTLTALHTFTGAVTDGSHPKAGLILGKDGNYYGTTFLGGASAWGSVFTITPTGAFTVLHSFAGPAADGAFPYASLVQGADGTFYGTASFGGGSGSGTVYKITPSGTFTTLHYFTNAATDGAFPYGGLVQGTDGNFYGTTTYGGAAGYGTVFQITPAGALTTLHAFMNTATDGAKPFGALIQGKNGGFYGTTSAGGALGWGTVFKITSTGTFTTLHSFTNTATDGAVPSAGLIQGKDGNFYGTTYGDNSANPLDFGTVFRITPTGTLTTLHSFTGTATDGRYPLAGLVQGTDGNLHGTTEGDTTAVPPDYGTVFKLVMAPNRPAVHARSQAGHVILTWTSQVVATSYSVYRGTAPGKEATTPLAKGVTTSNYIDLAVTIGTTYYYTVTASNAFGTSAQSVEVSATP